ncbi:MAG: hypothetical protein AAB932_01250 [Patescibacteria group bacterium]
MKKTTKAGLFSLMSLVFLFHESIVFGQQVYDLEIVAQTGVPVGGGTPVAFGPSPSINDAGKVAFVARNTANT